MSHVPARRRRSVVSVLSGALAMVGSLGVIGVLVLSDVADAQAPRSSAPEQMARVEQEQTELLPVEELQNAPVEASKATKKVVPTKRGKKKAKVDFGRFEGY